MTLFADTPIFEPRERESLNPYVRPYAAITKHPLVGLLTALGEYAIRVIDGQPPVMGTVSIDPEVAEKHRALVGFYYSQLSDASSGQSVFDAQERSTLSLHKYVSVRGYLSKRELLIFIEALERYSLIAPRIEQVFGSFAFAVRMIHAHNALVRFRDKPFTLDEYRESVGAVMKGDNPLIA